jgi:hypothetical protein
VTETDTGSREEYNSKMPLLEQPSALEKMPAFHRRNINLRKLKWPIVPPAVKVFLASLVITRQRVFTTPNQTVNKYKICTYERYVGLS